MRIPIDEDYVAEAVLSLRRQGFPSTDGYYLVVLSPLEARELVHCLAARNTKIGQRYKRPPIGITESAKIQGYDVVCVLDNALVVSADHTKIGQPRHGEHPLQRSPELPRHLRLVRNG